MALSPPQPIFLTQNFGDFDEMAEKTLGWDLDLTQLEPGPFRGDFLQVAAESFLFSRYNISCRHEQRGAPPPGFRTFGILSPRASALVHRNQKISQDRIIVFPPGEEIDIQAPPGFEAFGLSFTEDLLEDISQRMGLPPLEDLLVEKEFAACRPEEFIRLQSLVQGVGNQMASGPCNPFPQRFIEQFLSEIPRQLLNSISESYPITCRPSSRKRAHALKKIKEFLVEFPDDPHTSTDLCEIAQVSERTLEYAFQERYEITPNAYLRFRRLNQVRKALRNADPTVTTVTEVATDWGFWHFGHFTSHYRKAFGELPSDTLKTVRSN